MTLPATNATNDAETAEGHPLPHHLLVLTKADAPFLVDFRPADVYLRYHVVGSKNIPFTALLLHRSVLMAQAKVILLAELSQLKQAEEAYAVLKALGVSAVFVVPNGLAVCKQGKLSFTNQPNAQLQAFSAWFLGLNRDEKIPTVLGVVVMLISLLMLKRNSWLLGVGSSLVGFGLRKQLKTEQVGSVGQWVLKWVLKKVV